MAVDSATFAIALDLGLMTEALVEASKGHLQMDGAHY